MLAKVAERLRERGFEAHVAPTVEEARFIAVGFLPTEAEVLTAPSETLRICGLSELINQSGKFDAMEPKLINFELDEHRLVASTPNVVIGSVHAITEAGRIICTSATGSELAAYVYGARHVIWLVGSQKIVPDLASAFSKIEGTSTTPPNSRAANLSSAEAKTGKTLVIDHEPQPGRSTVILVGAPLGS